MALSRLNLFARQLLALAMVVAFAIALPAARTPTEMPEHHVMAMQTDHSGTETDGGAGAACVMACALVAVLTVVLPVLPVMVQGRSLGFRLDRAPEGVGPDPIDRPPWGRRLF